MKVARGGGGSERNLQRAHRAAFGLAQTTTRPRDNRAIKAPSHIGLVGCSSVDRMASTGALTAVDKGKGKQQLDPKERRM